MSAMDFTTEQKWRAINALAPATVMMANYGDFYVSHRGVSIDNKHMTSSVCGRGDCATDAIEDHFRKLSQPGYGHWVAIRGDAGTPRKAYRWNEFMWLEIDEEEARRAA